MSSLLQCQHISKTYVDGDRDVQVLKDVNFTINKAEQVAIVGASGSGKSTLLHILGALDQPTQGQVIFQDQDIFQFTEKQQAQFRNKRLGFVYQQHHLLPEFTALENVAMPCLIARMSKSEAQAKAKILLEKVGLSERLEHKPSALSGGERQRVAIARALVMEPQLVLADEPTGNLDDAAGESIYQLLVSLKTTISTSFVVVTHDKSLAAKLDRTLLLKHGVLTGDKP
ncbi:lipoprotein-releasing ABC transporter ATP-binding protein LolD [Planctobacterium marinum]|uniref:lipoprotein-releasing ABC transporter ATP-binding protein LolD n=1 Tax=Planctobacterium marinum TaxID=1631968 RepID=UPI001E309F09|nr:lipoprotein-releasing ABC transporter ATP-binding protein LolD [Planctobacterium marinum]MCC2604199.1 lipoprotein-releasing ABC transporter ATP-binding protein LolD [Planctobacterium marinum]